MARIVDLVATCDCFLSTSQDIHWLLTSGGQGSGECMRTRRDLVCLVAFVAVNLASVPDTWPRGCQCTSLDIVFVFCVLYEDVIMMALCRNLAVGDEDLKPALERSDWYPG